MRLFQCSVLSAQWFTLRIEIINLRVWYITLSTLAYFFRKSMNNLILKKLIKVVLNMKMKLDKTNFSLIISGTSSSHWTKANFYWFHPIVGNLWKNIPTDVSLDMSVKLLLHSLQSPPLIFIDTEISELYQAPPLSNTFLFSMQQWTSLPSWRWRSFWQRSFY